MRKCVCHLQLRMTLISTFILGSNTPQGSRSYFTVRFETPPIWGPGPCIYIPQDHGYPVMPQALGYHFVTSYNSLGYGRGIQTRPHIDCLLTSFNNPHHIASGQTARRLLFQQFLCCCTCILWCNMFTEPLPLTAVGNVSVLCHNVFIKKRWSDCRQTFLQRVFRLIPTWPGQRFCWWFMLGIA